MEISRIAFEALIDTRIIAALAALGLIVWLFYLRRKGRAWFWRALGLSLLTLILLNPVIVEEARDALPSTVALLLDQSESMEFGARKEKAQAAFEAIQAQIEAEPGLDLRTQMINGSDQGTDAFSALASLMSDVPRERVAGTLIITDGQIHDAPTNLDGIASLGPIHAVIIGEETSFDRRIEIIETVSFGIVGEMARFVVRAEDPSARLIPVNYSVNGEPKGRIDVRTGEDTSINIEIERRGENIVLFEVPAANQELTLANNQAAATLAGVRDRLRVMLITGQPHAAGRVWRDLLKSDPQVDLVHFTILRSFNNRDSAAESELSLIPFPRDELFNEQLDDFDLIIFDQYQRIETIEWQHLVNISDHVANGGALMIAAGAAFAGPQSLARTPLASILPAVPTGQVDTELFRPALSTEGERHTVTSTLKTGDWGRWHRSIQAVPRAGQVLMVNENEDPLLVVDRVGDGRVGLLLSDNIWLWARGYEGGGPFAELIRRLVHWLMKEPELEEDRLSLITEQGQARLALRTLEDRPAPVEILSPEGRRLQPVWQTIRPGEYNAEISIDELGLYRAHAGDLEAIAIYGPENPIEYMDVTSTEAVLRPISEATGGGVFSFGTGSQDIPNLRLLQSQNRLFGEDWFGLKDRSAYTVTNTQTTPLIPAILGVLLLLPCLLLGWYREGR